MWSTNLNPIIYKLFKDFTNRRKKTNWAVAFSCRPSPNILKYKDHRWDLLTIWKTRPLQTQSSASIYENHHWITIRTRYLWLIKVCYDLFNHLRSYRNIVQFQISSRREMGKEIPESSKFEFLEKFCFIRWRRQHLRAIN